jgi:hypothetical protein
MDNIFRSVPRPNVFLAARNQHNSMPGQGGLHADELTAADQPSIRHVAG